MILVMERFRKFFYLIIAFFLIFCCIFTNAQNTFAYSNVNENYNEKEIKRSIESLRDLEDQTW